MGFALRKVQRLRIYCPVAASTLSRLMAEGIRSRMIRRWVGYWPLCGVIIRLAFGLYRGVVELHPGWENFEPTAGATPTLGAAGARSLSPTVILTIHIPDDAPQQAVDQTLEAIIAAHPWEVPVIELDETRLLIRA
jgi:hypothetical protein